MQTPGNVKNLLKRKKPDIKKPAKSEKEKNKSAVRKLLTEGGDLNTKDTKVKFVKRSYETKREFLERMHGECQLSMQIAAGTRTRNVPKELMQAKKQDQNKGKLESERDRKRKEMEEDQKAILDEKNLDKVDEDSTISLNRKC